MPLSKRFNVPYLGFGIGLRAPHYDALLRESPPIDWLELISENFMLAGGRSLYLLDQFKERYRLIPHGVSLSIGASDPLDWDYLHQLKALLRRINAPWFSDHLCWSQQGGAHMHNLLPLVYTPEVATFVAEKIRIVQDFMEIPFLVENVSSYVEFKDSKLSEWEFLTQVVEKADCGVLLDINNIYVSARNHDFDPKIYIDHIPPERVIQYHIAGHDDRGSYILDTHDHPVRPDVWDLYAYAIPRFGNVSLMLERDDHIPPLPELIEELDHARVIHRAVRGPVPPTMLTELQTWMAAAIQSPDPRMPADSASRLTASSTLSSEERLGIYLNDYWPRCLDSLKEDFPLLLDHLGEIRFSETMRAYVQARPSTSFTLFHLPEALSDFMHDTYHAEDRAYVLRLVAYEWAKARAYFAEQAPVFCPHHLSKSAQADLPDTPLQLQPHVSLVSNPQNPEIPILIYRFENTIEEEQIHPVLFSLLSEFGAGKSMTAAIDHLDTTLSDTDRSVLAANSMGWFQDIIQKEWLIHPEPITGVPA